jgi:hypothetical protein
MTALSKILFRGAGGTLFFECPGCEIPHGINIGESVGPCWTYNGNADKPTFTPSILVRYPWGENRTECICHSFVTDGRIQFLSDCTHALAGQTVDIPDFDTVLIQS